MIGSHDKTDSFLHVVDKVDVALLICAIDKGQLNRGTAVAAVEDDEETAAWRQP